MIVNEPRFMRFGGVLCCDCPYSINDQTGERLELCRTEPCPTPDTYQQAACLACEKLNYLPPKCELCHHRQAVDAARGEK